MTSDTPEPLTAEEEAAERLLNDRSAEYRRGWDDAMNARITAPQLLRAAAAILDAARAAPQASYWEGFNDGMDALEAALGAAQEKGEAGS